MLHARTDYDRIQDPAGKIGEDEPVMLFRAKDAFAPLIVAFYAVMLQTLGGQQEMTDCVRRHYDRMIAWQKANGYKLPDMPADAVRREPPPPAANGAFTLD